MPPKKKKKRKSKKQIQAELERQVLSVCWQRQIAEEIFRLSRYDVLQQAEERKKEIADLKNKELAELKRREELKKQAVSLPSLCVYAGSNFEVSSRNLTE